MSSVRLPRDRPLPATIPGVQLGSEELLPLAGLAEMKEGLAALLLPAAMCQWAVSASGNSLADTLKSAVSVAAGSFRAKPDQVRRRSG